MPAVSYVFALISLILASYEDIRTKRVTNVIWWIFSAGLLMLPFGCGGIGPEAAMECIIAVCVQEFIMCRVYGRADSHAFSCCALFLILTGAGAEWHILHMGLSLAFLTAVQAVRGNIGRNLKLKAPVPFVPYISISFALTLIIM